MKNVKTQKNQWYEIMKTAQGMNVEVQSLIKTQIKLEVKKMLGCQKITSEES